MLTESRTDYTNTTSYNQLFYIFLHFTIQDINMHRFNPKTHSNHTTDKTNHFLKSKESLNSKLFFIVFTFFFLKFNSKSSFSSSLRRKSKMILSALKHDKPQT